MWGHVSAYDRMVQECEGESGFVTVFIGCQARSHLNLFLGDEEVPNRARKAKKAICRKFSRTRLQDPWVLCRSCMNMIKAVSLFPLEYFVSPYS